MPAPAQGGHFFLQLIPEVTSFFRIGLQVVKQNLLTFFILAILPGSSFAQDSLRKERPLNEDAYLHPVDAITPYTLKKGEWIYAQSIQTLPFPSWAFVGLTDKLTMQIDLLPWLFGSFTDLKKPIPSLNFRYRFNEQNGAIPTIGVEAMFVHFWDTLERFETENLRVAENGSYFHLKPSFGYQFDKKLYLNFSAGVDYMYELILEGKEESEPKTASLQRSWNPNFSFGVDYRPSKWISYHAGYTYGATLTYLENVPRKHQITYGFRMAPFYKSKHGFFRCFRAELLAINAFFPDIDAQELFPLPIFPYLYWQWGGKK